MSWSDTGSTLCKEHRARTTAEYWAYNHPLHCPPAAYRIHSPTALIVLWYTEFFVELGLFKDVRVFEGRHHSLLQRETIWFLRGMWPFCINTIEEKADRSPAGQNCLEICFSGSSLISDAIFICPNTFQIDSRTLHRKHFGAMWAFNKK